jgi:hypothetical protein
MRNLCNEYFSLVFNPRSEASKADLCFVGEQAGSLPYAIFMRLDAHGGGTTSR